MGSENKILDFNSQRFYIGIDVHKRNWNVTVRSGGLALKTYSMNPSPEELSKYLNEKYPGGSFNSVYEAGFSGYWTHRQLEQLGFNNIVVSPNEVPTNGKEKIYKTDSVDSRKLARELENGSIKGIYIPSLLYQELRSLVRLRCQIMKSNVRLKNQIKSYLNFYGHKIPENYQTKHWSGIFIKYLRSLSFEYAIGKAQLEIYLEDLTSKRELLVRIIKKIKAYCLEYGFSEDIQLLMTVPGIGFATAVTIYAELMDINRFSKLDNLVSYVGLSPAVSSSGERENTLGLKMQHNGYLRNLLIEAAWIAVRKDAALTLSFNEYLKRMSKQEAIIKIAKKLLNRVRTVWKKKQEYVCSVIK
ncbi:MAG: IS110 family transposase [Ignavibacteriaceae bacterium]|nr:IS110 family transposase [Ignavibacteriaceae bacterium]